MTDADMWLWVSLQQNSDMEATNCTFVNNSANFGAVVFATVGSCRLYAHLILIILHQLGAEICAENALEHVLGF